MCNLIRLREREENRENGAKRRVVNPDMQPPLRRGGLRRAGGRQSSGIELNPGDTISSKHIPARESPEIRSRFPGAVSGAQLEKRSPTEGTPTA